MDTNFDLEEGFINYNKDLMLKALLFSMVVYIVISPYISLHIKKLIPTTFEVELIQAIIFGLTFYLISINL